MLYMVTVCTCKYIKVNKWCNKNVKPFKKKKNKI